LRDAAFDAEGAPELELRLTAILAAERSLKRQARSKAAWRKAFPISDKLKKHHLNIQKLHASFLR
jgi:hypothetical protein